MTYRFLDFELDPDVFALRRRGQNTAIEPRVFDLMLCLIERRQRMVSKQELLERVWHRQSVVPSALARAVCVARRVVCCPHVIRTIHARGYQWAATVDEGAPLSLIEPAATCDRVPIRNLTNDRREP